MDYKQFEGHTPGPWQSDFEASGNGNYSVLDVEGWRVAWVGDNNDTRLIAAAPDLLKENQSLKLELQKQKELNAELVNWIKEIPYQWAISELYWGSPAHEKAESLIKKSNEI